MEKQGARIVGQVGRTWLIALADKGIQIEISDDEFRDVSRAVLGLMGAEKSNLPIHVQEWLEEAK